MDLDAKFNGEGGPLADPDITGQMDRTVGHGPGQVRFDRAAKSRAKDAAGMSRITVKMVFRIALGFRMPIPSRAIVGKPGEI